MFPHSWSLPIRSSSNCSRNFVIRLLVLSNSSTASFSKVSFMLTPENIFIGKVRERYASRIKHHSLPVLSTQSLSTISSPCHPVSVFQFVVTLVLSVRKTVLNSNATMCGSRLVFRSSTVLTPKITLNLEYFETF